MPVCENSHFICDACHSYGTYAPVIAALRDSTEKDALLLLEKIMDLPSVHMHGPEHHAIVPCVLLTAFAIMENIWVYDVHYLRSVKEQSRFRAVPVVTGVSAELLPEPVFSCPL